MKHVLSVLLGAASYGVLSTLVVKAYEAGYSLGEVTGSQMMVGFLLSWGFAYWLKLRRKNGAKGLKAGINHNNNVTTIKTTDRNHTASQGGTSEAGGATTKLSWKQRMILMAAGMPTAITGLLYYESLRYIPASLAILLLFQFTWISVLVQSVRLRKRPAGLMYWTLFILLSGTFLAAGVLEQGMGRLHLLGLLLGFLSAISYTLFILVSGKAVQSAPPAERSKWMMAGALLLIWSIFPPQFLWNGDLQSSLLLFGTFLGLFGAFIPPLLFAYGVPHIGEGLAGILGAAELPVAVLLSSVVLHEQVSALQWGGVVLVLIGIALPEWMKHRKKMPRLIIDRSKTGG
ncbi:EamA family transporter [Paenibacillus sp. CAU 1782]